jgi:hypothetical protein
MHIEHFTLRLKRPTGVLLVELERALLHEGAQPLRWAITAVEGDELVVEGARMVPCSPSST